MAAELQPPEGPIAAISTTATTTTTTVAVTAPIEPDNSGTPPPGRKRQRRPSVRLGEIGDQSGTFLYESHLRRTKHSWLLPKDSNSVRARSLTNLVNGSDSHEIQESKGNTANSEVNLEFGHRRKTKRATTKRVRSNWISMVEEGAEGDSRDDGDEEFRDFDQDSDSNLKEQSPVHSTDNVGLDMWQGHRRSSMGRARVSRSRDDNAIEMDNLPESDYRERKCSTSEGVRTWLIELGLSRYAPVFEMHEVDDEVLPLLTLEDLNDMGINAVGSRRKLYSAIQKLRKGFSILSMGALGCCRIDVVFRV